jgi:hypothetical protein
MTPYPQCIIDEPAPALTTGKERMENMSRDPYQAALAEIDHYKQTWQHGCELKKDGVQMGALFGLAIDSETLTPHAILLGDDGNLKAHVPSALTPSQSLLPPESLRAAVDSTRCVKHRKGGVYTVLGPVVRGQEHLILYVSHSDKIWWIRPRGMFIDGRFSGTPDTPISAVELFS